MTTLTLHNLEGYADFDITWPWAQMQRPGATAIVAVTAASRLLPFVVPRLLRACDRILFVEDGSAAAAEVVDRAMQESGSRGQVDRKTYPFLLRTLPREHVACPERSVHSMSYFRNWCLAQVRTRLCWDWPAWAVLTFEGVTTVADIGWRAGRVPAVVRVPWHRLYVVDSQSAFLDVGRPVVEEWGFPVHPDFRSAKGYAADVRTTPQGVRRIRLPPRLCLRPYFLDASEDAATQRRLPPDGERRRVDELTARLHAGTLPEGVVPVTSTDRHVVDHAADALQLRSPHP